MNEELSPIRPKPIPSAIEAVVFTRKTDIAETLKMLFNGTHIIIDEYYNNGLYLLNELKAILKQKYTNNTYISQREYRESYHKYTQLIIIEIQQHKLAVRKAPEIGWLKILYPELDNFALPFTIVQGLNSAWQWYIKGVQLPVLRNKIHPYYGTYFPTRHEHLILFDNWLKKYSGDKKNAIDVGIGSGVLSFQMIKYGFQKVFGTDINPNAIIGLREYMGTTKLSRKIELDYGNLFGKWNKPSELIVFNPPWLPESNSENNQIDQAIYYPDTLFPEFFTEAKERLLPDGKIAVIFSNLAQITNVTTKHPIINEIEKGDRFKLEAKLTRKVQSASKKTKRNQSWRENEEVELWILGHK